MSETTNYHFPLYDSTDKPNLRDQYNGAINMIDEKLNTQELNVTTAMNDIKQLQTGLDNANTAIAGKAPTNHASEDVTYGVGTATAYGHVKLADSGSTGATGGTAATPKMVNDSIEAATAPGKLLCIGDSYAVMEPGQTSWPVFVKEYAGFSDYTKYGEGGSGFVTPGISGHTFTQLAQQAIQEIEDKLDYTCVIVAGGRNDTMTTGYNTYYQAVRTIAGTLKTAFTNARIIIVPMLWDNKRDYSYHLHRLAGAAIDAANSIGCESVNWAWTWGLGITDAYDGLIHPLTKGGQIIGSYIASAIKGNYSGRTYSEKLNFGSGDCVAEGSGGVMTISIGGTYTGETQNAKLPDAFSYKNYGNGGWGVLYANGGTSTCVLSLGTNIAIYGGGNKGNIGGCFVAPW